MGERIVIEDSSKSTLIRGSSTAEATVAAGVRAGQCMPIFARDGRPLGTLATLFTRPSRPDARMMRMLDLLAIKAADLLEHRQREEALRRSSEQQIHEYQDKLRRMAFDANVAEGRERRRLAAVLHDEIGQTLALAQMKLTSARRENAGGPTAIDEAMRLVDESIDETRTLTFELSPPILDDLGLEQALSWLVEDLEKRYGLQIELIDDAVLKRLEETTAGLVFRAVRELLVNVLQARPDELREGVPAAELRSNSRLKSRTSGSGSNPAQLSLLSNTFGLFSVREQITRLGGTVDLISALHLGTRVTLRVPISSTPPSPPPSDADASR